MNYRDLALGASEWLLAQAIDADDGLGWPEVPGEGVDDSLYGGAGVILTMLDAYAATNDDRFVTAAARGVDRLTARAVAGDYEYEGFYVGAAGAGFIVGEVAAATGSCSVAPFLDVIRGREPGPVTDIIGGVAGVVCWLTSIGENDLADERAQWLASAGEPAPGGTRWRYMGGDSECMPNFSHGTAGNAYALAAAGLLEPALRGANHLVTIGERPDGGFRVRHFDDDLPPDYPLGWCHGPSGTARLFQLLADKTGDATWTELRDACAHTVRTSGIPERKEPGFWDNVAACCGSTGVAKFFLGLHRRTGDADHLTFARAMADDIVSHAIVDDDGVRWSNIEYRAAEPALPPELGQMQGAAGIASFLFELDRYLNGDMFYRRWPDNPF